MKRHFAYAAFVLVLFLFNNALGQDAVSFTPNNPDEPYLYLQIGKDAIASDKTLIRFNNQSSLLRNPAKPAIYRPGFGKVSISTIGADQRDLSIYTAPFPNCQRVVIRLDVNATNDGTYNLTVNDITNMPLLYDIWLKDGLKNDSVNMRKNNLYRFKICNTDSTTFGADRFTLVIRQNPVLAYHLNSFGPAKNQATGELRLVWKTQNEHDYTWFTVERSNDGGKTFIALGTTQSNSTSYYDFVDKALVKGANVYRLKQEDGNHDVVYSTQVTVRCAGVSNGTGTTNEVERLGE